jgi:hypothetical protein
MAYIIRASASVLLFFWFHAIIAAWATSAEAPAKPRSLSAAGKVTNEQGQPVPGATVYLREWAHARKSADPEGVLLNDILAATTADEHGAFSFTDVPLRPPFLDEISKSTPFPWDVIVIAKGHSLGWSRVPPKGLHGSLAVRVDKEAKLTGRVTDADGKPLSGASVRALRFQGLDQGAQSPVTTVDNLRLDGSMIAMIAETNADGIFSLDGMPRGMRIALLITHDNYARRLVYAATTDEPQPPVIVGRRRSASGEVTPREEPVHTGPLSFALRPGHRLRLSAVYEDTGKPAVGAVLRHVTGLIREKRDPEADALGECTIDQLAAARATFRVTVPNRPEYLGVQFSVTIPADEPEHKVTVKLPRGVYVRGKVVEERGGQGIAGVAIGYQPLTDADSRWLPVAAQTKADGSFQIAVPPGKGFLEIAKPVAGYVTPEHGPASRTEADERFTRPINVVDGRSTPEINFTLSRGLVAQVRILDDADKPAMGAEVQGRLTDGDGRVTLSGLFPFRNHDLIATLPDRKLAARFTLSPRAEGEAVTLDVKLQPTGAVSGRVLDEDGKPIRNSTIQLLRHIPDAETKIVFYAASDTVPILVNADGTYVLGDLVAGGSYNVNVTAPGHAAAFAVPFDGTAGGMHRLPDIILPRADQSIAGTVVDARGRPLAGVQVSGTPVRPGGIEHSVRITNSQVTSDSAGRFRLSGIPRGAVRLSAYVAPRGQNAERLVRTHATLMAAAGRQDVRLVIAGPDVIAKAEAVVGKSAPVFAVESWIHKPTAANKKLFQAGDFREQIIVVAFLDEAKPSARYIDRLNELHNKWKDRGLSVVRVYEGPKAAAELADSSPTPAVIIKPGLVPGGNCEAHEKYGVRANPTVFLIDRSGVLCFADVNLNVLESHLDEMLKP